MLFHVQFPFTDLRRFGPALVPRIPVPSWPAPIVSEEFVRSFGVIRERRKGGLAGWIAESEYCEAKRALRFSPSGIGRVKATPQSAAEIPCRVCFRRLYFDGYALGKVDVGFRPLLPRMIMLSMESLIKGILTIQAIVRKVNGQSEQHLLYTAGKPISLLYAYATSKVVHNLEQGELSSIIRSEAPILFIEMNLQEARQVEMPHYAREIPFDEEKGFKLMFWRVNIRGTLISVWCAVGERIQSNIEARSLRIYLLRLSAEHQTLKRILNSIEVGQIAPEPRDEIAQFLQSYINVATRRINICENKGRMYSSELDILVFSLFDIATPGQRDALEERLRLMEVRANIYRKVDDYAAKQTIQIQGNTGVINVTTGNETYNITNSSFINIKSKLENVQQIAGSMPAGDDKQKKELNDLLKQLLDALEKVPDDRSEQKEAVAEQAERFIEAAAKEKPNRTLLQTIGSGLN